MKWYVQECGMLLILEGDGVICIIFRYRFSQNRVLEGDYGSLLGLFKDLDDWMKCYYGHQNTW